MDGSGRVKKYIYIFLNSYVSQSPVRRTAQSALQSALHVMLLSNQSVSHPNELSINQYVFVVSES